MEPLQRRFLRAVDFVEEHLGEPVALGDVAKQAGFSLPYFSRLFRVLTGETFGAYLRRRRMTLAAERLASEGTELRLVDLAFECGYDSQEAFTRAFKRTLGTTPGAWRARPPAVRTGFRARIDAATLDHLQEVLDMEPEIVEIDSFVVAGLRERFDGDTKHGIPALWQRFVPLLPAIPHRRPGTYGICTNPSAEDGSFDYVAGVAVDRVDELPSGTVAESIPRQTYAVFRHHVRSPNLHAELQPTLRFIWGTWLAGASAYEYAGGPDFERYPPDFDAGQAGTFLDIAIPVRRRPA
jgi:AraC family transcriptional regulator